MEKNEIYLRNEDGSLTLISSDVVETPQISVDDLIKEKEDELLKMYQDLQDLKAQKQ